MGSSTTIEPVETQLTREAVEVELIGLESRRGQAPSLGEVQRWMPRANGDQDAW